MMALNKNFKYFKKRMNHWIVFLGFHDAQVIIELSNDNPGNRATTHWHGLNNMPLDSPRQFTVRVNRQWLKSESATKFEIDRTAFHEVLEMLLARLRDFSNNTYEVVNPREVDGEIHRFIRIMENRVLPKLKEK